MSRRTPASLRRRALIGGALASAWTLTGLAACSGSSQTSGQGGATALPAGDGRTTYPLELVTPYGTTTLEKRPQRVAVVDGTGSFESVLALGVAPVLGTTSAEDIADLSPWLEPYRSQVEGATTINPWGDPFPFEAIQAATPDLIVATFDYQLEANYDRLSQIAPVLGAESAEPPTSLESWKTGTRLIGTALDLSGQAEEVIASVDRAVASIASDHPEFQGRTVAVLINRGQDYGIELVNRDGSVAQDLLSQMGFAPHPNAKAGEFVDDGSAVGSADGSVSLENIGLVDADVLVVGRHGGSGEPAEAAAWMESNELYTRLSAVHAGRTVYLNDDELETMWAFSWPDALNIPWSSQTLAGLIAGVLADPGEASSQAPTS